MMCKAVKHRLNILTCMMPFRTVSNSLFFSFVTFIMISLDNEHNDVRAENGEWPQREEGMSIHHCFILSSLYLMLPLDNQQDHGMYLRTIEQPGQAECMSIAIDHFLLCV